MFDENGDTSPTPGSPNPTTPTDATTIINNDPPQVAVPPVIAPPPPPQPAVESDLPGSLPSWAQPTTVQADPPPAVPEVSERVEVSVPVTAPPIPAPIEITQQPEYPPTAQEEPLEVPRQEPRTEFGSDNKEDLIAIADQVTNLYLDYRLKIALAQETNTSAWEEAAHKNPIYAHKITDLAAALRDADKIKKESYPEADALMQRINFHQVEDEAARMLLTDILWRRATNSHGKLDRDLNLPEEATLMLKEMEVSDADIRAEVKLNPSQVVEKILSGKLRVTRLQKT